MSYQPPQGLFPPPPGSPTGPEGRPGQPGQPGQPGPPPGYPPPGYGQPPAGGPAPYTAPPPAPARPAQPISGRHLASLLLVAGTALLVLADLVAAFTAGDDTFGIEFADRLFLLGGVGGGFLYSIPTILMLSILVIAALRLREGSTGPFDTAILLGALVASALVTLFTLLALFGSFAVVGLDPRFGFILLLLGALVISVGATWYAFGEFQTSRPARPAQPTYPQGYPQAYQPPAQGHPPSGYPPQG
ncbi:MAG: hypothetical protein ACRD0A_06165 [Acidimicrobiales bacterium]